MELHLSRVYFPVTALGPGRRLGIWFQGCSIHCPGCISADTWETKNTGRRVSLAQLLIEIHPWLDEAEGITLSGGEPFDQPEALIALLKALRARSAADILVYSGYPLEKLSSRLRDAEGLIDALVSDPYAERHPQTLALRGSDNQRLTLLTDLGRARLGSYVRKRGPRDRTLDILFDADGTAWMAGIPERDDILRLRDLLRTQGCEVVTSVDVSRMNPSADDKAIHRNQE
jgi:anaerobic ribonucleoside-triphosphate reductase activating protein